MRLFIFPTTIALLATQTAAISRQECIDQGGVVVGDIGDGAIFTPEYICEIDGNPPTDPITPLEGEPIAIEGEICCGGTGLGIAYTMVDLPEEGRDELILPDMTDEECVASGGVVVEDISRVSIEFGDFVCELSGLSPIGAISRQAADTGTLQTVCCQVHEPADRDEMSRQECLDAGGVIVGDIGDGAIFNPDYTCESSGSPPIANIVNTEAPFAIEGEVCCAPGDTEAPREQISQQECMDRGGEVVNDIGDGSIHRDDYICESSGEPPLAQVVPLEGEPIAREGQVCCASEGHSDTEAPREQISQQECLDRGGEVVNDIGDGSIHRDDYICESSGEPPLAQVVPLEGEPIAREGQVCCASEGHSDTEAPREQISQQECMDRGGEVVNDIGDGSIHRDDYICESSGEPPLAQVVPLEGEPIAREGQVCCASEGHSDTEAPREQISQQECMDRGGEVVNDIGDGSIHRDDYLCESTGEPPLAQVVPLAGEPIAREGQVCCGGVDPDDLDEQESNLPDGSSRVFSWSVVVLVASFVPLVMI